MRMRMDLSFTAKAGYGIFFKADGSTFSPSSTFAGKWKAARFAVSSLTQTYSPTSRPRLKQAQA